jgi:tetratricopeptide (TPR) repeat protein
MFGLVRLHLSLILAAMAISVSAAPGEPTRAQALSALESPTVRARYEGVVRLGDIGTMADANMLAKRLHDDDGRVRAATTAALWQIWSRSGDAAIDTLYQRGVQEMQDARLPQALATFTSIIQKKPAFAEAWNKRATLHYMMGAFELSLKDCDEVIKRNPHHFGALSGYGQIYLHLGNLDRALTYFERAQAVNPSLPGVADTITQLQQKIQDKQRRMI